MADQPAGNPSAELLASTAGSEAESAGSFFKSVQWSADGTTLFTSSSANVIGSYVVPADLLQPRDAPLSLRPQGSVSLSETTHAVAPCPYFSLSNPYTHVLLTAAVDHPIQLHQAFPSAPQDAPLSPTTPPSAAPVVASYPLIHGPTEAYLPAFSLLWPASGTHFLAGSKNLIAYFDVERSRSGAGAAPILSLPTIPSTRHLSKGGGVGMRGSVSALAAHPDPQGPLAAGTWTRWIGLYDLARAGAAVANWSVAGAASASADACADAIGGNGILQTAWSPCGRYLVVNERKSSGLLVYDVRVAGRLLGRLRGRDADTHQRMTCDIFPSSSSSSAGFEVWAGSRTGAVLVYEDVGNHEGDIPSAWQWRAHGSSVGSTAMHASGSVVATCSGSWTIPDVDDDESSNGSSDGSDSSDESERHTSSSLSSSSPSSPASDESDDGRRLQPRLTVGESSLRIWGVGPGHPEAAADSPA